MTGTKPTEIVKQFIRAYPSDPEYLRTLSDIEQLEKIPQHQRFICNSPNEALSLTAKILGSSTAVTFLTTGSLADKPQRWTYSQYQEEVIAAANLFHSLGLQAGQSVAFLLPNTPEMLFGLWAAQAVGIAAPINYLLRPEQIAEIAREADAHIIVTLGRDHPDGGDLLDKALKAMRRVSSIQHIITVGATDLEYQDGCTDWNQGISQQRRDGFIFDRLLEGTEVASYFHTGGTTGIPKLAQQTHRAEVINVCQMLLTGHGQVRVDAPEGASSTNLCGLPLFHVNAPFVSALSSIMSGGELILAGPQGFRSKQLIKDFWGLIERYKVTNFFAVPTVYGALMDQNSKDHDISSLISGSCGAAPIPVSLLRDFYARSGATILEGYGMTETNCSAASQYSNAEHHVGSVGMRIPYHQIRTVILDGQQKVVRDCAINEIGVLLHNGPNVIPGYKQESANKDIWPESGWLNSGDMGRIDAQGNLWITGRAKDLIIRGGHNIDPSITEDALTCHPEVEMAAAVGKPDGYAGELPVAYVKLYAGATVTAPELIKFSRERAVERAGAAVDVFIVDELPKTAVGKIFKPSLRKDAIARAYVEIAAAAWPEGQITAEVIDDKSYGLKVILTAVSIIPAQTASSRADSGHIRQAMAPGLNALAYVWELN